MAAWELVLAGGKATKVSTRRSVAHVEHDRDARHAAQGALKFPPVAFTGVQAQAVGRGFAQAISDAGYRLLACAILPQHVHVVSARHARDVEIVVRHLKSAATRELRERNIDPMAQHLRPNGAPASPWGENAWHVFLDCKQDIDRAIGYVENNPAKEGLPPQKWKLVSPHACAQ